MTFSIYKNAFDIESTDIIPADIFFENIKNGTYWESVAAVRNAKNDDAKQKAKKNMPTVTLSGTFTKKTDAAIIEHSNFICIDIDKCDPEEVKSLVCADDHVYCAFTSVSGSGLAIVFKIDGKRHREAFYAISEYLYTKYSLVGDSSCVNPSRGRFVSHDPDLYINSKAAKWKDYLPKKEINKVTEKNIVFVKSDFDTIVNQILSKKLDIAGNYLNWVKLGLAISTKFGENGRDYWQLISQYRYGDQAKNIDLINKKYDSLLKAQDTQITIGTFYYFAKQAGIETYSIETKEIIKIVAAQKRTGGMTDDVIISNLKSHSDFTEESILEIVPQVSASTFQEDVGIVELIENEIKVNWKIRRNIINRSLEIEQNHKWIRLEQVDLNTIYLQLKKFKESISYEIFERILMSRSTEEYNPFMDFIEKNKHLKPTNTIKNLSDTISSDFGLIGLDRELFIKKWLIGIIASVHGDHSPLMLVLTGEQQNTGKTQFFRRLLPDALKLYYSESKLDSGKDDEILMTQKLVIMDDEMGGKSKKESARLKELTSKQTFSLREPYGRNNVDLNRIAVLCGTSNENQILNDPTGNRRIIPVHVSRIDHEKYNQINKTDLIMESYWLWHSGLSHHLETAEIKLLHNYNVVNFEESLMEEELVFQFFMRPDFYNEGRFYTTSEIVSKIDIATKQKLTTKKVGMILQKNGVKRVQFKRDDIYTYGYKLFLKEVSSTQETSKNDWFTDVSNDKNNASDGFIPSFQMPF